MAGRAARADQASGRCHEAGGVQTGELEKQYQSAVLERDEARLR